MGIAPESEKLKKAVKWVSDARIDKPEAALSKIIGDASLRFDLTPGDEDFLYRCLMKDTG